jgi:uncharacterized repeat protein (TIGR02543 family)
MKKLHLLLAFVFCFAVNLQAQTITTGTVSTSICAGATISVPYTITGTFTAGNVFTAQLSSSDGAFTSPVAIGTLTSTAAGTITATIPTATAQGSGYRIRVVSSAPVITGSTNVTNITVNALPTLPGNYPNSSVVSGQNTTITPGLVSTGFSSITAYSTSSFKGVLTVNQTSGVVSVTDAKPAGNYLITVIAFSGSCQKTTSFTLTVTNPNANCEGTTANTDYPMTGALYDVKIGDFNNDGKQDIATVNYNNNNFAVRLGNGLGGFAAKTDYTVGSNPTSIAIGDFNRDGNQDIAISNYGSNSVSICLGNSSGTFGTATNFAVANGPIQIALGDFNRDGILDFVTSNFGASSISICLGNGTGGFSVPTNMSSGSYTYGLVVGDFNGDGNSDIAVTTGEKVGIFLGDGIGGFGPKSLYPMGPTNMTMRKLVVADFNNDGIQDLAAANYGSSNFGTYFSYRFGDGLGGFGNDITLQKSVNCAYRIESLAVGDFNGDGKQDIVAADYFGTFLSVCLNDGYGDFGLDTTGIFGNAIQIQNYYIENVQGVFALDIGDFNGDGFQDIAAAKYAAGKVSIILASPIIPTITAGSATTLCSGSSVVLTASVGSSYLWSNGATTQSITASTSGNYTVQVTNASGCQSPASAVTVVTVGTSPTASISGNTSFCTGGNTVLTSTATAGSGTISSYQWQVGGVNVASAGTSATYTATAAGSYTVTVTNSNGCSFTSAAYVVSANALPSASISGNTSFCTGGNTVLTSTATAGSGSISSYQWKIGGVNVASGGTSATYTATDAGSYTVTVTNSNGCSFTSSDYVATMNALLATPTISAGGATTFCSGGSVVLTASAGTTYLWSNNATTQAITVTNAGSYTVQVTNASGCQSAASAATVVTISESLIPGTISSIGETICYNGDPNPIVNNALAMDGQDVYAIAPASVWFNGNYTIETWIYPRTFSNWGRVIDFGNGPGVDNVLLGYTEGTSGKPSLVNFGAGGVGSLTSSTQLVLNQWSHLAVSFNGTTATMYINGALVATGTMTAPNNVNRTSCLIGKSNFGPGDPNANAIFDELRIWNVARSLAEIQASMNVPLSGSETGLQAYYNFDHGIANGNNTSVTTLTDRTSNVRNATLNNVALTGTNSNFVSGSPVTTNATGGSGTITYKWQANGVDIANSNATTYDPPAGLTATTTYRRFAKDESCQTNFTPSTGSYVVSVNTLPTAPISGNTSFCTGGSTILTSNATAGSGTISSYQWKVGGVNVASAGTSATYTATAAGSYTVTVTNSNGCSFTSAAYVVSVNALPTATISGNTSFCTGGNTVLTSTATAGSGSISSYQWKIGGINVASAGTSATYTATAAGSYTVTVTNSNGCSFTSSAYVVSVNALPTLTIGSAITPANGATTADLTAGVSSDGTIKYYSDNAYTMEVTAPTVVTIARTYYIRATLNGCSTDDSRVVNDFSTAIAPPTITSFTPSSGNPGTLVTITGTDLGNSSIAFTIGGTPAIVISKTSTSLVGMVMPGSSTGTISISNVAGIVTNSESFTVTETPYPSVQQGNKLVGIGAAGFMTQGTSVSMSADGNTAIVGGSYDNGNTGAAWVYTKSGNTWSSQGSKLVATDATGNAQQGISVSLSADGNTAIVGGNWDNGEVGAAWVYTRSGSTWTQQGNKLVGTGANGNSWQGISVSLSADGNTAMVGGANDNNNFGAVWVYTRSGNTWTQQGSKLVGTDAVGTLVQQGWSVALSADGNTALVGGYYDNNGAGAAWVYNRSGNTWTQQGSKLVGTGAAGTFLQQGLSVALSANGNTAIVGGNGDNNFDGAAWVYTRSGSTWTQQGSKLVGTGVVGTSDPFGGSTGAAQGSSVSLSADGNTAMVGGTSDNSNAGATWVYTRSGTDWAQQGSKLVVTGAVGTYVQQGASVSLSADGKTAMVGGPWDNDGAGAAWVYVVGNSVTYDGNGNTGGSVPVVVSAVNGTSITLASNSGNLVKTGYTFEGWNTAANGSGTSYAAGASYTLSGDVRLYAKWTAITYRITAAAGAGGSISPATALVNAGSTNAYTITPEAGYLISDVTVDDTPATALTTGSYAAGGTYVFTDVQTDHTINVTFALACDNVGLVAATATSSSICADATTTLTYSGLTGTNASVTWTQFEDGTGTTYGTGTPSSAVGPGTYYAYATGDCGSAVSIAVTVATTPKTDPTFAQVAPICSGATMADLPPTSSNAVTGTWSPALNNLETTEYTFTPMEGQCANTATMTIVVTPKETPTFTQVAPVCSGATLEALVTLSNNGIEGTWSPALNNLEPTQYTFTPTEGQCATTAKMTITVTPNEFYYADTDGDGFGNPAVSQQSCIGAPIGYVTNNTDCDDTDSAIYPNSTKTIPIGLLTGSNTICNGTTVTYTIDPVANATSYQWTLPAGATGTSTSTSIAVTFGSTYTVGNLCVKAVNGACLSASTCLTITPFTAVPATPGVITGPVTIAPNTTKTYTIVPVVNATSYAWTTPANATLVSGQGTTSATFDFGLGYTTGTITVKASNCKGNSALRSLTVKKVGFSALRATQCGVTLSAINTTIYANPIPGATKYRFEVSNGGTSQSFETTNYYFNLTQLTVKPNYNTAYPIRVAVLFDNVWQDYGAACTVTTPAAPLTKVKATQCGQTLALMGSTLSADVVMYANKYRFEVSKDSAVVQELTSSTSTTLLTSLTGGAQYGTTYTIRVKTSCDNGTTWSDYGTSCTVTTPAAPLTTKVRTTQCGQTLPLINSTLYADGVMYANKYLFEVSKNNVVIQELSRPSYYIRLTDLTSGAQYGTAYTIRVKYSFDNGTTWSEYGAACTVSTPAAALTTKVQTTQCGTTLAFINSVVMADVITYANKYQFEISINNAVVQELTSDLYYSRLTSLTGGAQYGTAYTIRVKYSFDNGTTWSDYGTYCSVTTPVAPLTKLRTTQCGQTLALISSTLSADVVMYANKYRFEVSKDNAVLQELTSSTSTSLLTSLTGGAQYGTTYRIRVKTSCDNGTTWSEYGAYCSVTTPVAPLTKVRTTQCGQTLALINSTLYADGVMYANKYLFEVSKNNVVIQELLRPSYYIRLTDLTSRAQYGTAYTIRVKTSCDNGTTWSEYGAACTVTTPSAQGLVLTNQNSPEATISVYPNPFSSTFNIATSFEGAVHVRIIDITGKLIEQFDVDAGELASKEFGQEYVPGMYHVTVTQDMNAKNFKIVKSN